MKQPIKHYDATIQRSKHYAATTKDAYALVVTVNFDATWFAKTSKKTNPVNVTIGQIRDRVREVTGISSTAYVQNRKDWSRARRGIKSIKVTFYMDVTTARGLGVKTNDYLTWVPVDLNEVIPKNVIRVDFINKRKVS